VRAALPFAVFCGQACDRNPRRPSHQSVATHGWRPRWVTGCRGDYVGSTSDIPQIADDLCRVAQLGSLGPIAVV
jgi:hypothetical protein